MIGNTLSHYKILSELGRGGMGIVYKAQDTRLDRTVAIKVLPSATLATDDDRARFYREAKAAAALHHPNIASVFEIDEAVPSDAPHDAQPSPFLAMEYIQGETLDAMVKKAPLKILESIRIASQIAEGLKAAHSKDIVHRDIKSANVMLDADGRAKILDFGLAKTAHSTKLTRMGSTLGTMAYMSPEQARGEEVDLRTDLWAVGVVLYEMISGALPFASDYEQAAVYSILNEEPEPLTSLRTGVPMALEQVVAKCLSKERKLRYGSAGDLLVDLERINLGLSSAPHSAIRPSIGHAPMAASRNNFSKGSMLIAAGGFIALIASLIVVLTGEPDRAPEPLQKLELHLPGMEMVYSPALSPSGTHIAFSGVDTLKQTGLFVYDLSSMNISHVEGSEGMFYPLFSPSGNRMTFSRGSGAYMDMVDIPPGLSRRVFDDGYTGYWINDDEVLFSQQHALVRGSVSTGDTEIILEPDTLNGIERWVFPGPKVPGLEYAVGNFQFVGLDSEPQLYVLNLNSDEVTLGAHGVINPQAIADDILLYQAGDDNGALLARRFDPKTAFFLSAPYTVADPMTFAAFHAGTDGSLLIAREAAELKSFVRHLYVMDLESLDFHKVELSYSEERQAMTMVLSGDSRLAYTDGSGRGVLQSFVTDLSTGVTTRRNNREGELMLSVSRDGQSYYSSQRVVDETGNNQVLVRQSLDGSSDPDTLSIPYSFILSAVESGHGLIVGVIEAGGDGPILGFVSESGSVESLAGSTQSDNLFPAVSPDGNFLAYESRIDNSSSIIIQNLSSGERFQVFEPGVSLQWAPNGKSLFFVQNRVLRRLSIDTSEGITVEGNSESLVEIDKQFFEAPLNYEITSDGKSAVILTSKLWSLSSARTFSTLEWWRGYADELDRILEKD